MTENTMENVCRICLEQDKFLIDLKTCRYETKLSYYELFVECTGIALDETESSLICRSCKDLLSTAYELRVKAKKSTDYLRSKVIEIVEVKCETVLIEVKEEVEDIQIKDEEPEIDDRKIDNVADIVYKEEELRLHKKDKKAKKVDENKIFPLMFRCRFCLRLTSSVKLQLRCERFHLKENNGFECHHCSRRFSTRTNLQNHLYTHFAADPNRFKCSDCPETFSFRNNFDYHRRIFHPKDGIHVHICQICGRKFRLRNRLKNHESRDHGMHQGEIRQYICDICGKQFFYIGEIKIHIERVHLNLYLFKCKQCPKVFKSVSNLNAHFDSEHQDENNKKRFICDVCGKELKSKRNLKEHQTIHSEEYKFKCTFEGCKSVFKRMDRLRCHKQVHAKQNEVHQCEFCPKKFQRSSTLKLHMKEHMPEKMHKCKLCEKSFSVPNLLKEHERRVHLGVRFECPTCGASYSKKYRLKKHMEMHRITVT